ncbi:transcription factor TFIIIC subunit tfc4 [Coemansia sp. IMI 209128]|nr:transcription factor TFIIIC subunit tfc4 [Coemansia sp. IMI 209128]
MNDDDNNDSSVLFRDYGGYMSDEHFANNNFNVTGEAMNDEDMLREAVRSATEMLVAEGLGNMANIDFSQRQSKAAHTPQPPASNNEYAEHEDYENQPSGDESEDLPMAVENRLDISKRAVGRRSASTSRVNYNDDSAYAGLDAYGPADFVPDSFIDDDEDSDFEGFGDDDDDDMSSSSGDDEYHMMDIQDSAREAAGFARTTRRSRARRGKKASGKKSKQVVLPTYSIEVQRALGAANQHYLMHDLEAAYSMFGEAIRLDPNCAPAWKTMALIREEEGRNNDALQLYTVAAHLSPKDTDLWERLYSIHAMAAKDSEEAAKAGDQAAKDIFDGAHKHAVYCISQVIRNDPQSKAALKKKLDLLDKVSDYKGMASVYRSLLKLDPYDMPVIRSAASLLAKRRNDVDTPVKWLSEALDFYNSQAVKNTENLIAQSNARRARARSNDDNSDEDSDEDYEYHVHWADQYRLNPESTVLMDELGGYTYNDLNVIAELRIIRHDHEAAIRDIKRGARFIQGRGRATDWEDVEITDTFDSEYPADVAAGSEGAQNMLPIELRVKLGQCRLLMGQEDAAKLHFDSLHAYGVAGYQDLFKDVADTYMESGHFELAIQIYQSLCEDGVLDLIVIWEKMAKCYRDMQDYDMACDCAKLVIDADPNDVEMYMWLGDVYEEMGQVEKAMDIVNEASKVMERVRAATVAADLARSMAAAGSGTAGSHGQDGATQLSPAVEIHDTPGDVLKIDSRKPSEYATKRRKEASEERKRHESAMKNAGIAFKRLDLLKAQIDKNPDPEAIQDYCDVAKRLYVDWTHISAFYMADRSRPFRNYRNSTLTSLEEGTHWSSSGGTQSAPSGQGDMQQEIFKRMDRLSKIQRNPNSTHEVAGKDDREEASRSTTFRGFLFSRWFDMFLMYGKCLSLKRESGEAIKVLEKVSQSNVYHLEVDKIRLIRLVVLSIALNADVGSQFYTQARWWCGSKPTGAVTYKLVSYLMATNIEAFTLLTATNMYKFIGRQLDYTDKIYYNTHATSEAPVPAQLPVFGDLSDQSMMAVGTVKDGQMLTRSDLAALHSLAAHCLLRARSDVASIMQYTLALTLVPCDASLALHLGVAYLAHSCNSNVVDRQRTALKGIMYLERYAEIKYTDEMKAAGKYDGNEESRQGDLNAVVTQEIAYNFARAFHFLGFLELAAEYYQRALSLPISRLAESGSDEEDSLCDLRREIAYNLANLYIGSGAMLKARELVVKYCTID